MSHPHHATELERDLTERPERGLGFLVSAGLAVWVLSGPFGSSGGGGTDESAWSVVIQVMPAVQGAVVGMIALALDRHAVETA